MCEENELRFSLRSNWNLPPSKTPSHTLPASPQTIPGILENQRNIDLEGIQEEFPVKHIGFQETFQDSRFLAKWIPGLPDLPWELNRCVLTSCSSCETDMGFQAKQMNLNT
ncbi:hypothetical protein SK128_018175 [Halocaridina rubra]|uniref:Uncharacterized protein n=1 Tax=Halocaridina rubra TaxID=373956 RepID=A0AAN9A4Y6_HALRR